MKKKVDPVMRPVVLSEEVYWWLVKRKFELRARSIDEVLRMDLKDLPASIQCRSHPEVKLYGWEIHCSAMTDDTPESGESQNSEISIG